MALICCCFFVFFTSHYWFQQKCSFFILEWVDESLHGRCEEFGLYLSLTEAFEVADFLLSWVLISIFPLLIYSAAAHQCDLKKWGNGTDHYVICGYRVFINPEWFSIIPHGSRIYYIRNSVVFPFNTESKTARLSVPMDIFIEIIPIKCQTHFTFNDKVHSVLMSCPKDSNDRKDGVPEKTLLKSYHFLSMNKNDTSLLKYQPPLAIWIQNEDILTV